MNHDVIIVNHDVIMAGMIAVCVFGCAVGWTAAKVDSYRRRKWEMRRGFRVARELIERERERVSKDRHPRS